MAYESKCGKNLSHTLAYSLVALQEMNLAYKYPIIFWDCANLIVDSGAIEGVEDKSANYNKIARAVNKIITTTNTNIKLVDINNSERSFVPDAKNSVIYYGMAGLQGVGGEVIQEIIKNRPYNSLDDFMNKTPVNKTVMVSLIKSGAFDQFAPREEIMRQYLERISDTKKRLTMANFNGLVTYNLVPQSLRFQRQVFNFNKTLRKIKYNKDYYALDMSAAHEKFYNKHFDIDLLEPIDNHICIQQKVWKKEYDKVMKPAKEYITEHNAELLASLNHAIIQEQEEKYAAGNLSHWEMESLGMYYHEHELAHVNYNLYGIVPFKSLSSEPAVERTFKKGDMTFPIYKTTRIAGTVIAKDDMHSSISVLTRDSGVVNVKMNRDYFAMYNRRISEIQKDGTKKVKEEGWFQRGSLVVLNGFRRGDTFVLKAYKRTGSHQLYKITQVNNDGMIEMTNQRYNDSE